MNFKTAFDLQEIVKRAVKYLVEGGAVAVAAYASAKENECRRNCNDRNHCRRHLFALDMYAPTWFSRRQGTGFGIGADMSGFL